MPAVDSPEPDGLSLDEVCDLVRPLVRHPAALGMELTIYDPQLDPKRTSAECLVTLLESVLLGKETL
jgi:arginase